MALCALALQAVVAASVGQSFGANDATARAAITKVHLVSSNHLDVGE